MGSKSKAPAYASTTTTTGGLFGSSTSDKKGTRYTGTDNINQLGNTAWAGANTALANMNSNDYANDPNFQVYQDNFNRNAQQAYDTNVLSNITNRGLMRSSGLQAATNSFNTTLNEGLADLYDNYYQRQANNLTANQNTLNNLYDYITGLNSAALGNTQAVNNYNMWKYQIDQTNKSNLWGNLATAAGNIAGSALGGSIGGALGSKLLGTSGTLLSGGSANTANIV